LSALVQVGLSNAASAALLAVLVAGVACLGRRPALAHGLWLLVLLKLVTPPFVPLHLHWPERAKIVREEISPTDVQSSENLPAAARVISEERVPPNETVVDLPPEDHRAADAPPVPAEEGDSAQASDIQETLDSEPVAPAEPTRPPLTGPSWQALAAVIWIAGSCLWVGLASFRLYRFQRLLRLAELAPQAVQDQAHELAARLGLARCPQVWIVQASISPLLTAVIGKPRLLLPAALWARLNETQRATLLAHELAHWKRGDHWVRRLEFAVTALYWWHPALWWARRQIREAEEACCDAWVVFLFPAAAESYATALVETVAFLSQTRPARAPATSGIGYVGSLRRRLTMIMRGTTPKALSAAGFLLLAALGLLVLPLLPTWAETDPQPPAAAEPAVDDDGQTAPDVPRATQQGGNPLAPEARTTARPSRVREAQVEIKLMQSRVQAKNAELQESQALLRQAEKGLARTQTLVRTHAISAEDVDQAETNVEVQRARVQAREAELVEAHVRLAQAEGRLEQLTGGSRRPANAAAGAAPAQTGPAGTGSGAAIVPPTAARPVTTGDRVTRVRPPAVVSSSAPDREDQGRLGRVEEKLDRLLQEMEGLRQEVDRLHRELRRRQTVLAPTNQPFVTGPESGRTLQDLLQPRWDGTIERKVVPNPDSRDDPRNTPTVPLRKPN
jgi:beta-lactamase regulating signal transducer with metallopeptidase domain